jgi:hypothetical protein
MLLGETKEICKICGKRALVSIGFHCIEGDPIICEKCLVKKIFGFDAEWKVEYLEAKSTKRLMK